MKKEIALLLIIISIISCRVTPTKTVEKSLETDTLVKHEVDSLLKLLAVEESDRNIFLNDSINGIYIPYNLEDCFNQIDIFWTDSVKSEVKNMTEEEFGANAHFGIGMWIRNNWGLWSGSRLRLYFNHKGVYHPDDISSIILTSYYRRLTNKEIDLSGQINEIQDYWKPIQDCQQKKKQQAKNIFAQYNIGDSVTFLMPVENNNAIIYDCPAPNWDFDESKDLRLTGTIENKRKIADSNELVFDIRILSMSRQDIKILMKQVSRGSNMTWNLEDLTIEE